MYVTISSLTVHPNLKQLFTNHYYNPFPKLFISKEPPLFNAITGVLKLINMFNK